MLQISQHGGSPILIWQNNMRGDNRDRDGNRDRGIVGAGTGILVGSETEKNTGTTKETEKKTETETETEQGQQP